MTIEHEVNPFKIGLERASLRSTAVSRLVEEVEARLGGDQELKLFLSQGVLDWVRAGARNVRRRL